MITKGAAPTTEREGKKKNLRERGVDYLLPQLQISIELECEE